MIYNSKTKSHSNLFSLINHFKSCNRHLQTIDPKSWLLSSLLFTLRNILKKNTALLFPLCHSSHFCWHKLRLMVERKKYSVQFPS